MRHQAGHSQCRLPLPPPTAAGGCCQEKPRRGWRQQGFFSLMCLGVRQIWRCRSCCARRWWRSAAWCRWRWQQVLQDEPVAMVHFGTEVLGALAPRSRWFPHSWGCEGAPSESPAQSRSVPATVARGAIFLLRGVVMEPTSIFTGVGLYGRNP